MFFLNENNIILFLRQMRLIFDVNLFVDDRKLLSNDFFFFLNIHQ